MTDPLSEDDRRRLDAVVEIHKPVPGIYATVECWACFDQRSNDPLEWPCPTALAALGEDAAYRIKYTPLGEEPEAIR